MSGGNDFGSFCANRNVVTEASLAFTFSRDKCTFFPLPAVPMSLHTCNTGAGGDGGCNFWQPVQAYSQPKSSGLVLGRRPLGAILHSSNEPGEL